MTDNWPHELRVQARAHWYVYEDAGLKFEHAYAVFDAARDDRILPLLRASEEEFESLYSGTPAVVMADYAPYLWKVRHGDLLRTWMTAGWGQSWGIVVSSSSSFKQLRLQLKQWLLLRDSSNEECYYRFYDPRALRTTVAALSGGYQRDLFGKVIDAMYCEGPQGKSILRYTLKRGFITNTLLVNEQKVPE